MGAVGLLPDLGTSPSILAFSFFFCFLDSLLSCSSSGSIFFARSCGKGTAEGIRLSGAEGVFITCPFTRVNRTFSCLLVGEASSFLTEIVTVGSLVSGLMTLLIVTIGWSDLGAGGGGGRDAGGAGGWGW